MSAPRSEAPQATTAPPAATAAAAEATTCVQRSALGQIPVSHAQAASDEHRCSFPGNLDPSLVLASDPHAIMGSIDPAPEEVSIGGPLNCFTVTGLHISSTRDALTIFEACRQGFLPRVSRRLNESEKSQISDGTVVVFDEKEAKMKRWTDGRLWTPSRILGNFLVYRELERKLQPNQEGKAEISRWNDTPNAKPSAAYISNKGVFYPQANGLMKRTISLNVPDNEAEYLERISSGSGQRVPRVHQQHLVSYFRGDTANMLPTPDDIVQLRDFRLPLPLLQIQRFRRPVKADIAEGDGAYDIIDTDDEDEGAEDTGRRAYRPSLPNMPPPLQQQVPPLPALAPPLLSPSPTPSAVPTIRSQPHLPTVLMTPGSAGDPTGALDLEYHHRDNADNQSATAYQHLLSQPTHQSLVQLGMLGDPASFQFAIPPSAPPALPTDPPRTLDQQNPFAADATAAAAVAAAYCLNLNSPSVDSAFERSPSYLYSAATTVLAPSFSHSQLSAAISTGPNRLVPFDRSDMSAESSTKTRAQQYFQGHMHPGVALGDSNIPHGSSNYYSGLYELTQTLPLPTSGSRSVISQQQHFQHPQQYYHEYNQNHNQHQSQHQYQNLAAPATYPAPQTHIREQSASMASGEPSIKHDSMEWD
ncbi:Global transcription regulator sge1 [Coemansia sp. Benny D115]|nr:Global transcription regulator sge1 [Coemansia sp. Benny D115]